MHHDERPVRAITELRLRGPVEAVVRRGAEPRLTVIGRDEAHTAAVRTGYIGDTLTIDMKGGAAVIHSGDGSIVIASNGGIAAGGSITLGRSRARQHFRVSVGGVSVVSDGDVVVKDGRVTGAGVVMAGPPPRVELVLPSIPCLSVEGSGEVVVEGVQQDELEVMLTGSGTVIASGTVGHIDVRLTGSGDVDARNLVAARADVALTGSGDAQVQATDAVRAHLAGSGDIVVHGAPARRHDSVTGSGDIRYRG